MPALWGRTYTRAELMARVGDISQIGGVRSSRLDGGAGDGLPVVDVDTGSGFRFTVVPGRALDISGAWYKGVPLGFRTPTGDVQGARFEPADQGWLRSNVLGLLVTCGLDNIGNPGADESGPHGLHGRLSNLAASNVLAEGAWVGDEYELSVQGRVRQAALFAENLELKRRITTRLGSSELRLHDEVTNLGHRPEPMLIMYHMNTGYPIIDQGARLHVRSRSRRPWNEHSARTEAQWAEHAGPTAGWQPQVWVHDLEAAPDGTVHAALVNRAFVDGIGLEFVWNKRQLPYLNHWRQLGLGEYVTGIEPGNGTVLGRVQNRLDGTLPVLPPGATATFDLGIRVLDGAEAIDAAIARAGA
ncbi:MAG: aldose 1-epimerase family protein [Actinobacteria bacterium]|nr:aldose 1-epimerase family protein [Actinomycetota bacterium]